MEGESVVTQSIINEPHSSDMIKWKVKVLLLEVTLMNFSLRKSKQIKWKVKVVLLEGSLIKFLLRLSNEKKWKVKVVLLEV